MRRTRLLILLFILIIIGSVGVTYTIQKGIQRRQAPPAPPHLPENITAQANNWTWTHAVGNLTKVQVIAKDFRQVAEPSHFELRGVELRVFDDENAAKYDRITSAQADFDTGTGILFSEGDVEITMGVQDQPDPAASTRLLRIRSSGVRFDSKAGKVSTGRDATFDFDRGSGRARGAEYDSVARELRLHNDVLLNWDAATPARAMRVTTGSLLYREAESKIYLSPTARLVRGTFTLTGAESVVTLGEGVIRLVESQKARGSDAQPRRKLDYAADHLRVDFAPNGEVQSITGHDNARLVSATPTAQTTITSQRIDLAFEAAAESVLQKAEARGAARVESQPVVRAGAPAPDTRVLRSEVIELTMRPGGEEIDLVLTHAPGTIDFLPNRPGQPRRKLEGERLRIAYGAANQIQNFRAVKVNTRTEPQPAKGKPVPPPRLTSSEELLADFDPVTGQMSRLEQWNNFRYQEGERRAKADKAVMEPTANLIILTGKARVWDPAGSTDAERIQLNQSSDAVEANGGVSSTRLPDKKKGSGVESPMLSGETPVHAKAEKMTSTGGNRHIRYEGRAVLWQGANRITAARIDIDREKQILTAEGDVVSQFVDRSAAGKKAAPVFTVVKAPKLVYSDGERLAHYTGGSVLTRPNLTVAGREIRAWLAAGGGSTLERMFADGDVKMVQTAPDRTRTGTGDHGEYHVAEERMVLAGAGSQLVDTVKGTTKGRQLTWFARNDRLLVDGAESQPAITNLRKK